jgi:hypothetical protein
VANGTLYEYERSEDAKSNQQATPSDSSDEEERQGTYSSQYQGLHDDWWNYYEHSNDRADKYWPHHLDITMPTKKGKEQAEAITVYTAIPNMAESLKAIMHRRRKTGMSDTSTVYYSSWQSQTNNTDEAHSHLFMTSSKVTPRQRKRVLQYRYGLLPTNKLLHRYNKVKSTACPLCGGEDGGHHAVSSCPALSHAATLRHNEAGTAILKAIHQGCKGRLLLTSDVGWRKRHDKANEPPLPQAATTRNIQLSDLPDSIPIHIKEAITRCSIPDAILYDFDFERGTHKYILVEVKYCRDTDPEPQRDRASQQHQVLRETIQKYAPQATVDQVTLTLGVSGAIYNSFMKALKDKLGVTQPRLNTLINKLHHMAVASLNRIWDQRWAMINRLQLDGSTAAPRSTAGHHQSTSRRTTRNKFSRRRHGNNQPPQLPPKQGQG